jgi:hypothetical protein
MRNLLFLLLLTGCAAAESADPCVHVNATTFTTAAWMLPVEV